jgi:DNA polymerase III epsilon subunit family exonuclease
MSNICFIDFETTGIDLFLDDPIELGAILTNSSGEVIKQFHSYISPSSVKKFSKSAIEVHGINFSDVSDSPTQGEVINDFFEYFGTDFRFAGWNTNFDIGFFRKICHLNNKMKLYNSIQYRHIDVQTICFIAVEFNILNRSITSLSDLADFFGIQRKKKHSAIEDAFITFKIYQNLMNLLRKNVI